MQHEKIIIIIGPTASGKSELAVKLAKEFKGEIISADSRQVYRQLDIGSGKVPGRWQGSGKNRRFMYKGIAHYGIDIVDPKKTVSVAQFQRVATKALRDIRRRGKLPIICGGTAHWVDAVVYDQKFPRVQPNLKLRAQLEKKSVPQLYAQLKQLDPVRAKNIDRRNPRRLIRALEIVLTTGQAIPKLEQTSRYHALWIGLKPAQTTLYKKIDQRLKGWFKQGLLQEVENLHQQGLSWTRVEQFGLEYKAVALYLQNKIDRAEMLRQSSSSIKHYAKRQMTWWKRNPDINWIRSERQLPKILRLADAARHAYEMPGVLKFCISVSKASHAADGQ